MMDGFYASDKAYYDNNQRGDKTKGGSYLMGLDRKSINKKVVTLGEIIVTYSLHTICFPRD